MPPPRRPPKGAPAGRLRFNRKEPAGRLREAIALYRAAMDREPDPASAACQTCGEILLLAALTVDDEGGRACATCLAERTAAQLTRFRGL